MSVLQPVPKNVLIIFLFYKTLDDKLWANIHFWPYTTVHSADRALEMETILQITIEK